MAALPYMQFQIAEYLADTAHLSTVEHGAYLLLIFNYWQRGKALDNRGGRLAGVVKMSREEWAVLSPTLEEFFEVDGDQWSHKRIDRDLAAVMEKCEKARGAGRKSAERKANERSTDVEQTLNERSTSIKRVEETRTIQKQVPVDTADAEPTPPRLTKSEKQDVRHAVFKGLIFDTWKKARIPDSAEPPWDGAEGKQLAMLMRANPLLAPDGFRRLLVHRSRSEGVNLAERPSAWVRGLTKYGNGPLNRFNQPMERANAGTHDSSRRYAGKAGAAEAELDRFNSSIDAEFGQDQVLGTSADEDVSLSWRGDGSGAGGPILEGHR